MNPRKSLPLIALLSLLVMSLTVLPLEESEASEMKVVYDNFDDGTLGTNTGGAAGGVSPSGEDAPTINFTADSKEGDYALSINYDFSSGSWEGYYSYFNESSYDLSAYTDIRMWVKGAHGGEIFKIELKDTSNNQSSVYITAADGFSSGASTSWQELVIPLSDFSGVSMSQLKQVNIVFDRSPNSGTVYVDLIRFTSGGVNESSVTDENSTLKVGASKEFASIGSAVDNAKPGNTIEVYPGTYDESIESFPITVDVENVTIKSVEGAENTLIVGTGVDGFQVRASHVTISGFRMTHFTGTAGIIKLGQDTHFEADHCIVENNVLDNIPSGNAVIVYTDNVVIRNNYIGENNEDSVHIDGVYTRLENNVIDGTVNSSEGSGGSIITRNTINTLKFYYSGGGDEVTKNDVENVIVHQGSEPLSGLVFHHNNFGELFDVYSPDQPMIHAENNWWGVPSGPSPVGEGTEILNPERVIYDPWLKSPYSEEETQGLKGSINVEVTPQIFTPEVLSVSLSETSWDPEEKYMIETTVRDNDSLRDLENVVVKAYQSTTGIPTDNLRLSYTFWFDPADNSWHSSLGDGYINSENCSRPTDLSENQGTYEFAVSLDPTAVPATWDLYAEATDENTQTGNLENSSAFSVNVYTKVGLDRHALNFSGMQGERARPIGGPLTANVSTNEKFRVRVRLSGPLTAGSYTIPMSNISANGIAQTDTYQDVRTGCGYGKGVGKEIEWGLTIPESQEPGNYTTTFYVNVAH